MLRVLLARVSGDVILVVLSVDVGATGVLVASATDGGADGVVVVVSLDVVLNGLMDSGRSGIMITYIVVHKHFVG